ncbi:DUF6864 domain-containing function [Acinetobacter gerneri]|uniref:DUF6864 domain-containing function n=1 Tax=Acinetobacter gerneri TaxID=202952 RepID=UPI003AF7B3FB
MKISKNINTQTFVGDYLVFKSETVFVSSVAPTVKIIAETVVLTFEFSDESEEGETDIESTQISPLHVKLKLKNFSNPLATGILEPIKFGTIQGKDVYFTFTTNKIGDKRSFSYALLVHGGW